MRNSSVTHMLLRADELEIYISGDECLPSVREFLKDFCDRSEFPRAICVTGSQDLQLWKICVIYIDCARSQLQVMTRRAL